MDTGVFKSIKGDEFVNFMIKIGAPKEEAEKLKGTVWRMDLSLAEGDLPIHMVLTCENRDELNYTDNFAVDKDKESKYFPFYCGDGGKATLLIEEVATDRYKGTATTAKYGKVEWTEDYTQEGNLVKMTAKGETITELWTRE